MNEELENSISLNSETKGDGAARLELLFEIGSILAAVETMDEAAAPILELICRRLDFGLGELWCPDEDEARLHLESVWHSPHAAPLEKFVQASRSMSFSRGEGLPGKVWARNAPVWLENLYEVDDMPRRFAAEEVGLQSGFGFPIRLGARTLGAFSFFSRDARRHDDALLQIFAVVGGQLGQFIKRERSENRLRASEERYRAFVEQSTEGIWRFELDEKISTELPVDDQVKLVFKRSCLAECNDAMARMYGLRHAEELIGSRIHDLFDMNDPANVEYLRAFIESGYNLIDAESHERDALGADKYFLNSLVGTVENDFLIRVWGTQRDVTEIRRAESQLTLLAEISEAARTIETPEEFLFAVSKAVGEHLEVRRCLFNEIDLERDCETVHRDYCRGVESVTGRHRLSDYSSITSADMQAGKTVVNRDSKIDERTALDYAKSYAPNGERAYITVPLLRENRWVASIWVSDDKPRDWTAKEIHLLETVAERTWTAVEKIRINKDLRESEERYRSLFESIDEGFCLCEMIFDAGGKPFDYKFLEVNPTFEKMTGLEAAAGRTAREMLPSLEARWFEIYGKVVTTGEAIRFTDGSEIMKRWFDVYASPVGAPSSRRFALLFTNITERKRAETALRESQSHLALALKVGRAGTFEWNIRDNVNVWSPEIEMMYGVPIGTFEGDIESWKRRVEPIDAERVGREIAAALEARADDLEYDFRAVLPDGERRWFTGRARFEYDADGKPLTMIGINVDITERKLTEIALSAARARLESTLTAGEIGTWTWNVAEDRVFADKNLARMFSVSEAEANGGKIERYIRAIHAEDRERIAVIIGAAVENGADYEADYRLVSPSGEICWVVARGTVERDADGNPVSLPGVVLDITERKQAEFEREMLFIEAEKAREIAEQANYAKDEFIALVSHELRSPLNAMLGWTRILQNQQPDEKTRAYALDVIVRNARSQSRLIEDLLDIARVGKGKLRVELEPTELIPIIRAAVETVKPAAIANQIKLTQNLDRAADFINGDADRLRQVIENLLSNAVKFTEPNGSVEIRLERENDQAKITVSDTGQGFSPEFQPLIFERFKQADPSTTRRHGGLGIGLSLARDLVELHGGAISAESAGEDLGATFTVSLPLRAVAPINENSGRMEFMDSHGKLSGFWILAVDDEADARELVSFMLQINGAKVTTANSAVEALDILKNSSGRLPDILLSDISMPNESGYALLEKVRALPEEHGGQIPAVALTAFNRPEDREAAFDAGFQKHLGKPVEPDDLITAIIETAGK